MKHQAKLFCCFLLILCCFSGQYSLADPLTILSVVTSDVTCDGYSDGSIKISITGGTPDYTYSWTGGNSFTTSDTVYTITGLSKGTYWVVVDGSSAGENDFRFGILVNGPDPLILNPPVSADVSGCFGNSNGQISVTGTGGTLPYTFTLKKSGVYYDANPTGVFPGLPAGTYTVELNDAGFCGPEISGDITINEPTPLVLGSPTTSDVTCNGGSNGSISITASGGTPAYTYSLYIGAALQGSNPTGTFTGLSADNYTIQVTDANGCGPETSGVIAVGEPTAITLGAPAVTDASCNGGSDGSISITASGGTPGYTYSLYIGAALQGSNSTGTFTGLSADNYTIQVTDANGCGPETSGVIAVGEPTAVTLGAPTVTNVTGCFGDANGSISISAGGGTPGYTYTLKKGGITQATNSTGIFNTLVAGVYTIEVYDANNCGPVISPPITVNEPTQLSMGSPSVTDVSGCFGNSNGQISVTGTGGTLPYTFTLKKSGVYYDANPTGVFPALPAGTYTVELDDAGFCGPEISGDITIDEPPPIVLGSPTTTDVTCNGGADGTLSITASGGTPGYTYSLYIGAALQGSNPTGIFTGLSADNYTIQVTDANGCGPETSGVITVGEPTAVTLGAPAVTDANCNGGSDGSISITASGGTPAYTYSLYIGAALQGSNPTGTFTGLSADNYTIQVTDANGCGPETSGVITVGEPTAITLGAPAVTDASCNGGSDGSISITASGGTPGYTYSLYIGAALQGSNSTGTFTGLSADNYTIQVTDANGCGPETSGVIAVGEPTAVTLGAPTVTDVTGCFGDANGSISISAGGGTPGYTYTLKKGGITQATNSTGIFNTLVAGVYTIEAYDANNCGPVISPPITINEPTQLSMGSPSVTDVSVCFGNSNGQISVTGTGGTLPYTFTLKKSGVYYDANPTGVFPALPAGTYTVELDDAGFCGPEISGDITIDEPPPIVLGSPTTTDVTCNGGADGTLSITASGGTPGYTYSLYIGAALQGSNPTGTFIGLSADNYTIQVTDANGCGPETSGIITVVEPSPVTLGAPVITDVTGCFGDATGSISISAAGGTPGYTYTLKKGGVTQATSSTGVFNNLVADVYTIEVDDANNCGAVISPPITVNEPTQLSMGAPSVTDVSVCFGNSNGQISVTGTGGTLPYTFTLKKSGVFYDANPTGVFPALPAGTYTVELDDAGFCGPEISGDITIDEPPPVVLGSPTTSDVTCNGGSDGTLSITASGGKPPYTYTLKKSGIFQSSNATGNFAVLSAGIYTVEAIDDNGCGPEVSGNIEIFEPPAIGIATEVTTNISCNGANDGTISVTATGGTPGYVYTLKKGGVVEDSNINGLFVDLTPANDYTIEVTDTNGCGPFISNLIAITEPSVITINSEVPYDITCNGANDGRIDILASGGTPPYTYSVNGGLSFVDNGGNFTGLSVNNYTVVVKDSRDCEITGNTFMINEPPALSLVADTTKATCNAGTPDGSLRLSVSGGIPSYEYSIDNGLSFQSDSSFTGLYAGNYNVVIKDNNSCLLSESVEIEARINVNAYAGEDASICPGTEHTLSASGGDSYLWSSAETISDPTSGTIIVSSDAITSYILSATIELCTDTDTVTLSIYPVLGIDAGNDIIVQPGGSVVLTASQGFASYSWLPSEYMSDPVGSSITVTPLENTLVYVTGTTGDGCLETDSLQVVLAQDLTIPSGFTPNNDGVNDTWEITNSILYPDMVVDIFTRWGAKIFHARGYDADNYWDGTFNGKDLPMGTYYYVIQLNDPFGTKPVSGPLTIIR